MLLVGFVFLPPGQISSSFSPCCLLSSIDRSVAAVKCDYRIEMGESGLLQGSRPPPQFFHFAASSTSSSLSNFATIFLPLSIFYRLITRRCPMLLFSANVCVPLSPALTPSFYNI